MRKPLLLAATAAATAMLALSSVAPALAVAHDVLTTGKVGGANVAVHDVLQAGLKARTVLTFIQPGTTTGITCTKSTVTSKVTGNPVGPGTATLSLTGQTASSCTINFPGVTVVSITVSKLPYRSTISDAKGDPVTVFGPNSTIKLKLGSTAFSCIYSAKKISGKASNAGSLISFTKQVFSKTAGSAMCPASGAFSATYGPVADMTVKGHPDVFVN